MTDVPVWTVVHEHRHGTDVHVYDSELKADFGSASLVLEWAHEVENIKTAGEIIQHIEDGEFSAARDRYNEAMVGNEIIHVETGSICGDTDAEMADLISKQIEAAKDNLMDREIPEDKSEEPFNAPDEDE